MKLENILYAKIVNFIRKNDNIRIIVNLEGYLNWSKALGFTQWVTRWSPLKAIEGLPSFKALVGLVEVCASWPGHPWL